MESQNKEGLLRKFESILPEFLEYMNQSGSEKKLKFIKGHINLFLEELKRNRTEGVSYGVLNSEFVNDYFTQFIPNRFPHYTIDQILFIQKMLKMYFVYLTTKKVLKKRTVQELIRKIYRRPDLKKKINRDLGGGSSLKNNLNSNKVNVKIGELEGLGYSSQEENEITIIKKEILKKLTQNIEDGEFYTVLEDLSTFLHHMSEKLVIKAILDLIESIEDNKIFWRINLLIQERFYLKALPSRIIKILAKKSWRDVQFYRLLIIYQGLFYSGYLLEKGFAELLEDLNVNLEEYLDYLSKFSGVFSVETNANSEPSPLKNIKRVLESFDIEKEIEEIKPFNKNMKVIDDKTLPIFNFPEGYDIDIKRHITHLESILNSPRQLIDFVKSSYQAFETYFKKPEYKNLMRTTQRLYYDGNYQKALRLINKLLKEVPENGVVYYFKAKILETMQKDFNALRYILKSLEIDPLKVETYMDLTHLLESGGYFYSSLALTSLMIQVFPFDFNFCFQLAISSSQLSYPFKHFLRLAGLIDPARTSNFLTRFWLIDKFKSRDSLDQLPITPKKFKELLNSAEKTVHNAINVMKKIDCLPGKPYNTKKYNDIIGNPLYFFPEKNEHTLKNWFIYELTQRSSRLFYNVFPNFFYLVANEKFINLCFKISKRAANIILRESNKRNYFPFNYLLSKFRTQILENLKEDSYFNLITEFISVESFRQIFASVLYDLLRECKECGVGCVEKPSKWAVSFYEIGIHTDRLGEDLIDHARLIRFLDHLNESFYCFLEEKGLKKKTIETKVNNIESFFHYIMKELKVENRDMFKRYITPNNIRTFLEEYVLVSELVTTQTDMEQMRRSLKNLIRFLHKEFHFFEAQEYKGLISALNKSEFFIRCLEEYLDSIQK